MHIPSVHNFSDRAHRSQSLNHTVIFEQCRNWWILSSRPRHRVTPAPLF